MILDALEQHDVAYAVIGGFAVALHQVTIPPTRNIAVTPDASSANLQRLAAALRGLNARFRTSDSPNDGVDIPGGITADLLAAMVTITLWTDAGPLDVAMRPDGTTGYDDLSSSAVIVEYRGRDVPVASLSDVIRSKEAAGREKDLLVLPALRAHRPHRTHQISLTSSPLSLAYRRRGGTRHRNGGPRPTELGSTAQHDPHRLSGACNTTHIIAH
jgi:hypothetical protein